MPISQPYSAGARAGRGIAAGLESLGTTLGRQSQANLQQERELQRQEALERYKEAEKHVMAGEPVEQWATYAGVAPEKLALAAPSVETKVKGLLGKISGASSLQDVPGPLQMSAQLPANDQVAFGQAPSTGTMTDEQQSQQTGDELPSTLFGPTNSPDMAKLMAVRGEKLVGFPPIGEQEYVPSTGAMQKRYVPANPETLTGQTFQQTPTTEQKLRDELAIKTGLQPQAVAQRKAEEQGAIDVRTSQENTSAQARYSAAIANADATARENAAMAGVPKAMADLYVHGTARGHAYLAFPPGTDRTIQSAIVKRLAAVPNQPTKIVTEQQAQSLQLIQAARANYDSLMSQFQGHLAKDALGRPLSTVKNTLGVYLQTDPVLKAAVATDFPLIIQGLKAQAGNVGRIMQIEVTRMSDSIPQPSDTWQVAQLKKLRFAQNLANVEDSILGKPPSTGAR
jgi:hypothetical protein